LELSWKCFRSILRLGECSVPGRRGEARLRTCVSPQRALQTTSVLLVRSVHKSPYTQHGAWRNHLISTMLQQPLAVRPPLLSSCPNLSLLLALQPLAKDVSLEMRLSRVRSSTALGRFSFVNLCGLWRRADSGATPSRQTPVKPISSPSLEKQFHIT